MNDEHDEVLTDELATSLRATAALAPRSADPYGSLGQAIAHDRRRRRTGIGASLAVVAVLGGAIGISNEVGRGTGGGGQTSAAAADTTPTKPATPTAPPTSSSAKAVTGPTGAQYSPPPVTLTTTTNQETMIGWPTDYSLFPGYQSSKAAAGPTVDAMIKASSLPVGEGTRKVLTELVGSFKLCGYSLDSYTFTLRWAGDLAHSGGNGAAVVDVKHGGTTFRMVGYDSYKGIWLQLPTAVDAAEAPSVEAVAQAELDQPAQVFYATVFAAPGSRVTVAADLIDAGINGPTTTHKTFSPVTVGSSGVAEVKLTTRQGDGDLPYPSITGATVVRPDGTTVAAPLVGNTTAADEQAARSLLPADTTCPGPHPATPGT